VACWALRTRCFMCHPSREHAVAFLLDLPAAHLQPNTASPFFFVLARAASLMLRCEQQRTCNSAQQALDAWIHYYCQAPYSLPSKKKKKAILSAFPTPQPLTVLSQNFFFFFCKGERAQRDWLNDKQAQDL